MSESTLAGERKAPRLARFARAALAPPAPAPEQCELCSAIVPAKHLHLVDVTQSRLLCACRACAVLFDRAEAGGHRYRLVPERVRRIRDFALDDATWARFRVPVDLAFFFRSSAHNRVAGFYPGPMGATESLLEADAWEDLLALHPAMADLEDDVEALLVDRTRGRRDGWLVPVDRCYELVGLIRTKWKGLAGGSEVWTALNAYFDALGRHATFV